jgi:hypothetical protein
MAGRGPAPKAQHQRERDTRRRQGDVTVVERDDVLRGPDLPAAIVDPHPETIDWWRTWRLAPQAALFEETDWSQLKRAAILVDSYWKGARRPSAAAAAELRLIEERFGASFVDRQRAKIRIEDAGQPATVTPIHAVGRADAEARLRGGK